MGMDIIDEVHIARKQYLDGSIPTGFQRTAIVGLNGSLPFKGRNLTITHVSLEEDSCREVKDKGHRIVWRTDRLGMPLTETVTGPGVGHAGGSPRRRFCSADSSRGAPAGCAPASAPAART